MIVKFVDSTVEKSMQKNDTIIGKKFDDIINKYLARISLTEDKIKLIENKEIINAEIYIIRNHKIKSADFLNKNKNIFYKDLERTISGKILPVFKNPPIINIIPTNGMEYIIKSVTKDYFELNLDAYSYEMSSFDIWFAI